MQKELQKLLDKYSYNEIVQAINSIAKKKDGEHCGKTMVHG